MLEDYITVHCTNSKHNIQALHLSGNNTVLLIAERLLAGSFQVCYHFVCRSSSGNNARVSRCHDAYDDKSTTSLDTLH